MSTSTDGTEPLKEKLDFCVHVSNRDTDYRYGRFDLDSAVKEQTRNAKKLPKLKVAVERWDGEKFRLPRKKVAKKKTTAKKKTVKKTTET